MLRLYRRKPNGNTLPLLFHNFQRFLFTQSYQINSIHQVLHVDGLIGAGDPDVLYHPAVQVGHYGGGADQVSVAHENVDHSCCRVWINNRRFHAIISVG